MKQSVAQFALGLQYSYLPKPVIEQAKTCLTDTLAVGAAGSTTRLGKIIANHAHRQFGGDKCRIMFDGRTASPVGAALANGMIIDSIDAHDGHTENKGHVGVGVISGLLALAEANGSMSGEEFITCMVVGYEIGTRAGLALHRSVTDYHTSGAWVSLACAAVGARILGLNEKQTKEALGIAEYHGPRSQMMRCIAHPTMLKDGSGWGAMCGVSAAYLAADGFTGAPAITIDDAKLDDLWSDLGTRWNILEQHFKLYPVCRWSQPTMASARSLMKGGLQIRRADEVTSVRVYSFHNAICLHTRKPETTEQAQYSLPFPLAALLLRGRVGCAEVSEDDGLKDAEILALADKIDLIDDEFCSSAFPQTFWGRIEVEFADGKVVKSELCRPQGDHDHMPFDKATFHEKWRGLLEAKYDKQDIDRFIGLCDQLESVTDTISRLDLCFR